MTGYLSDSRVPVIVGVGEIADRPADLMQARDPLDLMVAALRRAEADAGAPLVDRIDALEIINEISWPYADPAALLADRLGLHDVEATYHPVGGQTPMLALHRAALLIQSGPWQVAAICGAEAQASVTAAKRAGVDLPWTPAVADFVPVRGAAFQQPIARALDLATPAHVYPFYESATRASWRQSLDAAAAESGTIWATNAAVAATRPAAWKPQPVTAEVVTRQTPDNRLIAWPYTKLMTANPNVNQGAAVILCSLAVARSAGIPDHRLIHIHGGAAADEPRDYLARDGYARSSAMEWVLERAQAIAGDAGFDAVELYSCFPVVPKMARRRLGLPADAELSVAGGLTFFGAPLNNYMTHATAAMVERLRACGGRGLLYAQGEYVTKHHALVLGTAPAPMALGTDYRRADGRSAVDYAADYAGPARAEAATMLYDRLGQVRHGGVILTTADGRRVLGCVPATDHATIDAITSDAGVVGRVGQVRTAADGIADWTLG